MNEISVTKFLVIHCDKKMNIANHITEISAKVAKSIGLLHKLNRFLPKTILNMLYTSLIHPYSSQGVYRSKHGMEHIQIIPLKSSFLILNIYVR